MIEAIAQLEGRKRVLLLGEHYTEQPLSKDHREDILRWIHDLDFAISVVQSVADTAPKRAEAVAPKPDVKRVLLAQPDDMECE